MEYPNLIQAINVIAKLRHPKEGCPWDLEQTHQSLLKYLIEESYEYIQATEENDPKKMEEELGDVLLQVLLHAQIGKDNGLFDLDSVAKTLAEKMIYRHPHVFKDKTEQLTSKEVLENWDELKKKEKKDEIRSFFNDDDLCMPALMSAQKIGKKSKKVNFDWDKIEEVLAKVDEELLEVKEELHDPINNKDRIKDEIGDLLFSVTQLARHLEIDAEDALRQANKKFINRFSKLETLIKSENKDMLKMKVPELEAYWQKVKRQKNG